jgi:putative oxidoreductase
MNNLITRAIGLMEKIPHSLIAFIARFSIAAVFWKSGQTKVEGLAIDLIDGTVSTRLATLGGLDDSVVPERIPRTAAVTGNRRAHGSVRRTLLSGADIDRLRHEVFGAGAAGHDAGHRVFVYPDAYPTHGTWAAVLLYLMATGPGNCRSIT